MTRNSQPAPGCRWWSKIIVAMLFEF
jgi:hypothetical protein